MLDESSEIRQRQTIVLQKASPTFWRVLRKILTDSPFSALAYNGLVHTITEWYVEGKTGEVPVIQFALSHSRIRVLPTNAYASLRVVCEAERLNLALTAMQRRQLGMVLQKLSSQDFG